MHKYFQLNIDKNQPQPDWNLNQKVIIFLSMFIFLIQTFRYLFSSANISPVRFVLRFYRTEDTFKNAKLVSLWNKLWSIYLPPSLWLTTMKK